MATERDAASPLTERQAEILQLLADGLTGPAVSRELWLSHDTIKTDLRHAYDALGVHTQAAAVARAWRAGWSR